MFIIEDEHVVEKLNSASLSGFATFDSVTLLLWLYMHVHYQREPADQSTWFKVISSARQRCALSSACDRSILIQK